jgi:hypothetical protein
VIQKRNRQEHEVHAIARSTIIKPREGKGLQVSLATARRLAVAFLPSARTTATLVGLGARGAKLVEEKGAADDGGLDGGFNSS